MLDQEYKKNACLLSKHNEKFIDDMDSKQYHNSFNQIDKYSSDVSLFMQGYEYDISAWPLFIDRQCVADFDELIENLVPIIYKAIKLYFGDDKALFSEYLGKGEWLSELLAQANVSPRDLLSRHDVIYSDQQLKLIEINSGSMLGGWQLDCFEHLYTEKLTKSPSYQHSALSRKRIVDNVFKSVNQTIARKKSLDCTGNVLFYCEHQDADVLASSQQYMSAAFDKSKLKTSSQIIFFSDFDRISFDHHEQAYYDGVPFDAVLLVVPEDYELPTSMMMRFTSSCLKNKLVFPDCPVYTVTNSKSLFALLYEQALWSKLSEHEKHIIEKYVPWTVKLTSKEVVRRNKTVQLDTLLHENKDDYVIKKSHSMQGRDVFVGKFTSPELWQEVIEQYRTDSDWIVQAYCPPDIIYGVSPIGTLEEYSTVWGIFDFSQRYQGAFVRGTQVNSSKNGVINSANGAIEFIVYEEEVKKQKMKI